MYRIFRRFREKTTGRLEGGPLGSGKKRLQRLQNTPEIGRNFLRGGEKMVKKLVEIFLEMGGKDGAGFPAQLHKTLFAGVGLLVQGEEQVEVAL